MIQVPLRSGQGRRVSVGFRLAGFPTLPSLFQGLFSCGCVSVDKHILVAPRQFSCGCVSVDRHFPVAPRWQDAQCRAALELRGLMALDLPGQFAPGAVSSSPLQRRPTYKGPQILGRVPLDLRFRGPLEAKSFARGPKIDPPGAPGRVFDLKCRSCGRDRRCKQTKRRL